MFFKTLIWKAGKTQATHMELGVLLQVVKNIFLPRHEIYNINSDYKLEL